jgi:hypothetical protein
MDYKVKLTKSQNEHHHMGVFDTWTRWAKPHAMWALGPAGRLGFESARPRALLIRLYVGSQGRIRGLKAVEAKRSGRPTTWMAICSKLTLPSRWRLPSAPI